MLRSGRAIVYEPRYAVYHEHRETLPQLRRQYWTWGLGFMAFLAKSRAQRSRAQAQAGRHRALVAARQAGRRGCCGLSPARSASSGFLTAELWGGIVGMAGEYDRSLKRVQKIREQAS